METGLMIQDDKVVSMFYTLKDDEGNILDASRGEPLEYLQGHQNIIPGLEKELTGLNIGDKKQVKVSADEGYGPYNPELKFTVDLRDFGGRKPQPGQLVQIASEDGMVIMAQILEVQGNEVFLDANHPLAGKALHFDVEITQIRDASADEIAHGHPHHAGMAHH